MKHDLLSWLVNGSLGIAAALALYYLFIGPL
jgi:hypothetical protein